MKLGGNEYTFREAAGAFGDLGTLVPFVVGYITINRLDAQSVLLGFGLVGVVSGFYFRTPMPVQPMKGIGPHHCDFLARDGNHRRRLVARGVDRTAGRTRYRLGSWPQFHPRGRHAHARRTCPGRRGGRADLPTPRAVASAGHVRPRRLRRRSGDAPGSDAGPGSR
ncbi:MAG: hypothetical protein DMD75_21620 [Candidatus Rokuibacteriota bacterium]|nr:MAG: hypothetical protein DMD75_21620 [Candidatus Rokubacteria bacterium]